MNKILITGAAGYLGSAFTFMALNRGLEIVGVDNFINSSENNIIGLEELSSSFRFENIDLAKDKKSLVELMKKFRPDNVVHFASLKSVPDSQLNPLKYWSNNLFSTVNLVEAMSQADVQKILLSSSASVYGPSEIQPVTENMTMNPGSTYANTKKQVEIILEDISKNKKFDVVSLRYFNPVGFIPAHNFSQPRSFCPESLMDNIVNAADSKNLSLSIYGNDYETSDGTAIRDFIHIQDLLDAHFLALPYLGNLRGYEVFNVGTGKPTTVLELVNAFMDAHDIKFKLNFCNRRPGDIAVCYADNAKIKKELGWEAKKSLLEMCIDSRKNEN